MVDRLTDDERKIINENWNNIKKQTAEKSSSEVIIEGLTIKAEKENDKIKISIAKAKNKTIKFYISLNAKIIKFKLYSENEKILNTEKK